MIAHKKKVRNAKSLVTQLKQFEWKHHNLILLFVSIIVAYFLVKNARVYQSIENIGGLGYIGSFFSGALFTYGLTTAPATAALFILGKSFGTPLIISIIGASGAVISDYLIFRFVRGRLLNELQETEKEILGKRIKIKINPKGLATKFIPILAGLIIASPLPDEFGVAFLAAAKIPTHKFIQYAFIFNFIGIFIITSIAAASV